MNLDQMLSPHFSLREAIKSDTARRRGIINVPDERQLRNMIWTAGQMEKIRHFGGEQIIDVTSWLRVILLNRAIGSSDTSAHIPGFAVDHNHSQMSPRAWWNKLTPMVREFEIDQLILEYDDWVHVGFRGPGGSARHQVFTIGC